MTEAPSSRCSDLFYVLPGATIGGSKVSEPVINVSELTHEVDQDRNVTPWMDARITISLLSVSGR